MQLNGGRDGRNKKLHEHVFVLKHRIIFCSLCGEVIAKHENMARHTDNKKHQILYQKKLDGAIKLHQRSLQAINPNAVGAVISDSTKDYRMKVLIAGAKHNVTTDALVGLATDIIDKYSSTTSNQTLGNWDTTDIRTRIFLDTA